MIYNDPMLRKKGEDGYISKDPVILQAAEALESFNGKYHFPKGPNGGGGSGFGWEPTLIGLESSTGAILPSDFDGPGSSKYNTAFGDIICTYFFDKFNPREVGPYIISIGDKGPDGTSGGYLHNIVAFPFMNAYEIEIVARIYPINIADMYPDPCPVAVACVVNPDGTIAHLPLDSEFVDDYQVKITFSQEVCEALANSCGSAEMTECLYGVPN